MKYVYDRNNTTLNQLWKDVLQSQINKDKKTDVTEEYVLASQIYYKKIYRLADLTCTRKYWFDKGIKHVDDLTNEHGEFYDQTEFIPKNKQIYK